MAKIYLDEYITALIKNYVKSHCDSRNILKGREMVKCANCIMLTV